jgi:hypothetical protein
VHLSSLVTIKTLIPASLIVIFIRDLITRQITCTTTTRPSPPSTPRYHSNANSRRLSKIIYSLQPSDQIRSHKVCPDGLHKNYHFFRLMGRNVDEPEAIDLTYPIKPSTCLRRLGPVILFYYFFFWLLRRRGATWPHLERSLSSSKYHLLGRLAGKWRWIERQSLPNGDYRRWSIGYGPDRPIKMSNGFVWGAINASGLSITKHLIKLEAVAADATPSSLTLKQL